jgi:hypothetical protein
LNGIMHLRDDLASKSGTAPRRDTYDRDDTSSIPLDSLGPSSRSGM